VTEAISDEPEEKRRRREKHAEKVTAVGKGKRVLTNRKKWWCGRERLNTTRFGIYIVKARFGLGKEKVAGGGSRLLERSESF
jgi:hypothetical protein